MPYNTERFAQFAANVFDIPCDNDLTEAALKGIEAMENFYRFVSMPTSISEMGITLTDEQIDTLAYKCSFENKRTIGVIKPLNMEDIREVYKMAR